MEQVPSSQPTPQPPSNQNDPHLNNIWGEIRLGILVLGVVVLTFFGRYCDNKKVTDNVPGQAIQINHPAQVRGVQSRVSPLRVPTASKNTKTIKTINQYVPPEGSITITPKDPTKSIDDLVTIKYKEIGWTFEPGVEISGNLYYAYGLDAKIFYAYRFGFGFGLVGGSNVSTVLCPDVFASYHLDQIYLRNTEAIITYVPVGKIPLGIGIRLTL